MIVCERVKPSSSLVSALYGLHRNVLPDKPLLQIMLTASSLSKRGRAVRPQRPDRSSGRPSDAQFPRSVREPP